MELDDWQLLDAYANRHSDEAFRALVDRYAGLAYHAALHRCGNSHQAEEIAQSVFIDLARKAGRMPRRTVLAGWIFQATRFAALNLAREESRRKHYEQEAAMSESLHKDEEESAHELIAPDLYEAMDKISKSDRDAILIRFFHNKSHREVACALGVSEDAAKARVSRALERLRMIFAKRGLATTSAALLAALSAHGAPAAPPGLSASIAAAVSAKGATGAGLMASSASGFSKWMAWGTAKTAIIGSAGLLLLATGTVIAIKAFDAPVGDIVSQLERQSGQTIITDRNLSLPVTINIKDFSLEEALDRLAVRAGAYWTVDYAIYDSDAGLARLKQGLREASSLQAAGWTNLSRGPHEAEVVLQPHAAGIMIHNAIRLPPDRDPARVGMVVDLAAEASADWLQKKRSGMQQGNPMDDSDERKTVSQAMKEGEADGVLVPERLLAELSLLPRIHSTAPVPASPEEAARIAKLANAHWATIYTLRKSPLPGAGIRLIHRGMETIYGPPERPVRFELTPDDRDAHDRAVEAWKQKKAAAGTPVP